MRVDHVIYASRDLDAAAARLERELGVPVVGGGRHEGLGTHNRIMPLGGGYLEVLAVADPEEAGRSEMGIAVSERISEAAEGLAGWCVAVEDVAPVAVRLGTTVTTIARQGLTARLTGWVEAMREPFLPFFIARDPGVADPGASGGAGGITWIEVAGDAARLERWLGGENLSVRAVDGEPAVTAVGIGSGELRPLVTGTPRRAAEFGFPGPLRDRLVAAVLRGEKTATSSLLVEWEEDGEPLPRVGERQTVVDSEGRVIGIIEVVGVDVIRLGDCDLQLALDEGEGFRSVAQWREAHEQFWAPRQLDDDTQVVVERFRLVD